MIETTVLTIRTRLLLKKGLVTQAIVELRNFMESNPADPAAWFMLGVANEDRNELSRASAAFEISAQLTVGRTEPSHPNSDECIVRFNLSLAYDRTLTPFKRIAAAKQAAERLKEVEYKNWTAPEWDRYRDHLACIANAPLSHYLLVYLALDPATELPIEPAAAWYFRADGQLTGSDHATISDITARIARPGLKVVEVGSAVGLGSTRIFGDWVKRFDGELVCVDTWSPMYGVELRNIFDRNIDIFDLTQVVLPMQMPSKLAAEQITDQSCDLVFIDGDHSYSAVRDDIDAWRSKVKPGGILCGDDCEGRPHEFKLEALENHKEQDVASIRRISEPSGDLGDIHCGVVLAVGENFGNDYLILGDPPGIWAKVM